MESASSLTRKGHSSEIIIKVLDKDGHVIKVHRQKMHSIVMQIPQSFVSMLQPQAEYNIYMLSATNLTTPSLLSAYMLGVSFNGPFPQGIVLGSGSSTSPASTVSMSAPYYNGSSPNQMTYWSPTISLSQSSTQSTISITQIIKNQTSSSETVSELGLIGTAILTSSMSPISAYINTPSPYAMFAYDNISPSITVPSLGSLQVTVNINFD